MVELAADEEVLVQIEGLELMTEYLSVVKKEKVREDFMPSVEKMLKTAVETVTADEIRIKMAKLSGKIIDKLAQCGLVLQYETHFLDFMNQALKDKCEEVK